MKTVGSYEAKTHLPRLLDEVARGESITITKHGVPVAILSPVDRSKVNARRAAEELRAFGKRHPLGDGLTIRELIDEGRKY